MAKKPEKANTPKVTSLPLPISDTPLVIDLPDGQKIVIGKMQSGSVIEVATWRGTGRPDSRTNRLMMGMNNGETLKTSSESPNDPIDSDTVRSIGLKNRVFNIARRFVSQLQNLLSQISSQLKKRKLLEAKIQPASQESASALSSASEVDEWLSKVLERSERKYAKALGKTPPVSKKAGKTGKTSAHKKSKRKS